MRVLRGAVLPNVVGVDDGPADPDVASGLEVDVEGQGLVDTGPDRGLVLTNGLERVLAIYNTNSFGFWKGLLLPI